MGEMIQLDTMRNMLRTFRTLILRANPDPMMPEDTVSVIDSGTASWLANSTVADPTSWAKNALGYRRLKMPSVNLLSAPLPRRDVPTIAPSPTATVASKLWL